MSTTDVPGANPANHDHLAMGCWAEHNDGSLIRVESTEAGRVIFSIFEMRPSPPYRDSMMEGAFTRAFSWDSADPKSEAWTWHDKTPFPWDRIIAHGARDGVRYPSADAQISAAERVRRSREIYAGSQVDIEAAKAHLDQLGEKAEGIIKRVQKALSRLPKGK